MTAATATGGEWLVSENLCQGPKLTQAWGDLEGEVEASRALWAAPAVGGLAANQGRAGGMGLVDFGKTLEEALLRTQLAESGAALARADGGVWRERWFLTYSGAGAVGVCIGYASWCKVTIVKPTGGAQTHRVPELEAFQLGL